MLIARATCRRKDLDMVPKVFAIRTSSVWRRLSGEETSGCNERLKETRGLQLGAVESRKVCTLQRALSTRSGRLAVF